MSSEYHASPNAYYSIVEFYALLSNPIKHSCGSNCWNTSFPFNPFDAFFPQKDWNNLGKVFSHVRNLI